MPKYTIQDEGTYLDELRSQLLTQIATEWPDKWAGGHGPAFVCIQDLPSQNAFFEKLVEDMDKVLNQKLGLQSVDYFITKHTLRRFLDTRYKGGFNDKTRKRPGGVLWLRKLGGFCATQPTEAPTTGSFAGQ